MKFVIKKISLILLTHLHNEPQTVKTRVKNCPIKINLNTYAFYFISNSIYFLAECEEFSKLTTSTFAFVPLVIDPPVYEVEVPQCDYSVPLIVGGEEAKPAEFPHMAAIGWDRERDNGIDWNCGGVLISNDMILTAAHCTQTRG